MAIITQLMMCIKIPGSCVCCNYADVTHYLSAKIAEERILVKLIFKETAFAWIYFPHSLGSGDMELKYLYMVGNMVYRVGQ